MVFLCLVFRKKTCADKTGGTSSFVTQQRGLLPPALSPLLLPVGRRVCKCHRKGEGWYLENKIVSLSISFTHWQNLLPVAGWLHNFSSAQFHLSEKRYCSECLSNKLSLGVHMWEFRGIVTHPSRFEVLVLFSFLCKKRIGTSLQSCLSQVPVKSRSRPSEWGSHGGKSREQVVFTNLCDLLNLNIKNCSSKELIPLVV